MKNDVILVGGGEHCRSLIDVIEQEGRLDIVGIVEKDDECAPDVSGYPVIGTDADLPSLFHETPRAIIAQAFITPSPHRADLFFRLKK